MTTFNFQRSFKHFKIRCTPRYQLLPADLLRVQLLLCYQGEKFVLWLATTETRSHSMSWNGKRFSKYLAKISACYQNFGQDFLIFTNSFGKLGFQIRTVFISYWIWRIFLVSLNAGFSDFFQEFFLIFGEVYEDFLVTHPSELENVIIYCIMSS